jgi:hypothetical protein
MRKKLFVSALAVSFVMLTSATMAAAADNWIGSWKLNVAKSKYSPGPAPKGQTLKFEATPAGIKLTTEGTGADGKPATGGYTSKFDGKDVPWMGNPDADTASPKRIDDNNYENGWKKGGKPTITSKGVVAADGKTLTVTSTGKNAKGDTVNNVAVYDKQ